MDFSTPPSGGTLQGQHERTVDMLEDMKNDPEKQLWEMLYFLYDSQTTLSDLKQLSEIALRRHKKGY